LLSPDTPVSSTNKTDRRDIAEILLKVALRTITKQNHQNIKLHSLHTLMYNSLKTRTERLNDGSNDKYD
jgi:AAA+ superfamily predicted ATPase